MSTTYPAGATLANTSSVALPNAPAPVPLINLVSRSLCVDDYGAKGDGVTDDGPAFQACINAAYGGQKVMMTNRDYLLNTAVAITQRGISMHGVGRNYAGGPRAMTTLLTSNQTPGFTPLTVSGGNAFGTELCDFGIYQVHPPASGANDVWWTPAPYGPFIAFTDIFAGFRVHGIEAYGVTQGIYVRSCGHFEIGSVVGQFFNCGIQIENCQDRPSLEYLRSWPYETNNYNVMVYTQANLQLLRLGRVDGIAINDLFSFVGAAVLYGYQEPANAALGTPGGPPQFDLNRIYGDHVTHTVLMSGVTGNNTQLIARINTLGGSPIGIEEQITGNAIPLMGGTAMTLTGCSDLSLHVTDFRSGYTQAEALHVDGSNNALNIGAYEHNTANFSFLNPAPPMILVQASTGAWPNRVIVQSGRILNNRNAAIFGGTGASQNTYMGPCFTNSWGITVPGLTH